MKKYIIYLFILLQIPNLLFAGTWIYKPSQTEAKKGDIILSKDPHGVITPIIESMNNYWDHCVMVVSDNGEVRHNTMSQDPEKLIKYSEKTFYHDYDFLHLNPVTVDIPRHFKPDELSNGTPGTVDTTLEERGKRVFSARLSISNEVNRPYLHQIADKMKYLDGYYRINSYVNLYQFPNTNTRQSGYGGQCSSTIWHAIAYAYEENKIDKKMYVYSLGSDSYGLTSIAAENLYALIKNSIENRVNDSINNSGGNLIVGLYDMMLGTAGIYGLEENIKHQIANYILDDYKAQEKFANQVVNTFLFDNPNDLTDYWRDHLDDVQITSISPDQLLMVGMPDPTGGFNGIQNSSTSYYDAITDYTESGGYYYYLEENIIEPPIDPRPAALYNTPCDIPNYLNKGIKVECCNRSCQ